MTHKWDYKHPINAWERMPWWLRWPLAALITAYFAGSIIAFTIGMNRLRSQLVERPQQEHSQAGQERR